MICRRLYFIILILVFITGNVLAEPVKVGSKIDTEGALLGSMIVLILRDAGIDVEDKTELGPTNIVRQALVKGQIDIYPEYTGNGAFLLKNSDKTAYKNWERGYRDVKKLDYEQNRIVWLRPSPANNTWAIAVTKKFAEEKRVKTLEDMADYINRGGETKIAVSEEFTTRADALPAFQKAYGFRLASNQMIILSGGNTAQTESALARGTSGVNFAMAYGTDGAIAALGLKVLEDTKGIQPVYAPAPVIREDTLKRYPQIEELLVGVFEGLDMETLQALNGQVAVNGISAAKTAEMYLKKKGFIK